MIRKSLALVATLTLAISLVGCAQPPGGEPTTSQLGAEEIRFGRVIRIQPVELTGDHQLGVGAVVGAAAGVALGSVIGAGTGRDVAMVLGAIGGGVAGNYVQNKYVDRQPGQHITVQVSNGVLVAITQPANPDIRVGDQVKITGSGMNTRVVRI